METNLRAWSNGLAVAGLILTVGVAILASGGWKPTEWVFWAVLGGFIALACLAIALLRPTSEELDTQRLRELRRRVSVRDMAVLSTAINYTLYPKDVSDRARDLAPPGETWAPETEFEAQERARRLIDLGLLQWRASEIETTDLGHALVSLDDALQRARRNAAG
jgi:hypothetical protein